MPDDSAEIVFQSVLQDAVVSCSAMSEDVHSLTLSIQHFLCRPRRRPLSKVPWSMLLERLSWRVTCPNHAMTVKCVFFILCLEVRGGAGGVAILYFSSARGQTDPIPTIYFFDEQTCCLPAALRETRKKGITTDSLKQQYLLMMQN